MFEFYDIKSVEYCDMTHQPMTDRFARKYICEIHKDGTILEYGIDPKTGDRCNEEEHVVNKEKVDWFFDDLKKLMHSAHKEEKWKNDRAQTFKINYTDTHYEVISAYSYAGNKSALDIYKEFIGETDDYPYSPKSTIEIVRQSITGFTTDAIVNAANEGLAEGGGVCGYIFDAAGSRELTKACQAIGHCDTGSAVITPAFKLGSKHIIHAVGPIYRGGKSGEAEKLYGAYYSSMKLAKENGCRSIAFPLISAGIFGYPLSEAWDIALKAVSEFIHDNRDYTVAVYFAILDNRILEVGRKKLEEIIV